MDYRLEECPPAYTPWQPWGKPKDRLPPFDFFKVGPGGQEGAAAVPPGGALPLGFAAHAPRSSSSSSSSLTWGAVVVHLGLQLFIPFSKTDSRGEGDGCPLDPLAFLKAWREASGGSAADATFFPVRAGVHPAAKDTMLGRMRCLLQRMGMLYGLHSLRHSGVARRRAAALDQGALPLAVRHSARVHVCR